MATALRFPFAGDIRPQFQMDPWYWTIVILEAVGITVTVVLLKRIDRDSYIMPATALIVGLHFFALRYYVFRGGFLLTAGTMCALSLATIYALAQHSLISPRRSMALTGFGCAAILWFAALAILLLEPS